MNVMIGLHFVVTVSNPLVLPALQNWIADFVVNCYVRHAEKRSFVTRVRKRYVISVMKLANTAINKDALNVLVLNAVITKSVGRDTVWVVLDQGPTVMCHFVNIVIHIVLSVALLNAVQTGMMHVKIA